MVLLLLPALPSLPLLLLPGKAAPRSAAWGQGRRGRLPACLQLLLWCRCLARRSSPAASAASCQQRGQLRRQLLCMACQVSLAAVRLQRQRGDIQACLPGNALQLGDGGAAAAWNRVPGGLAAGERAQAWRCVSGTGRICAPIMYWVAVLHMRWQQLASAAGRSGRYTVLQQSDLSPRSPSSHDALCHAGGAGEAEGVEAGGAAAVHGDGEVAADAGVGPAAAQAGVQLPREPLASLLYKAWTSAGFGNVGSKNRAAAGWRWRQRRVAAACQETQLQPSPLGAPSPPL